MSDYMQVQTDEIWEAVYRGRLGPLRGFLLVLMGFGLLVVNGIHGVNANSTHTEKESQILSWSIDGTARVWNATTGEEMLTLKHDAGARGAVWNNDGSQILSWSDDGTARVWNATTGEAMLTLKQDANVRGAMWNRDESQILSWSIDGTVHVWNAATGEKLFSPVPAPSSSTMGVGAMWNANESQILSWVWWWESGGSPAGTIHVWDVERGEEVLTLPPRRLFGAKWNEDGSLILLSDVPRVIDAITGEEKVSVKRQRAWIVSAIWNKDESQILSWYDDGTAHVWNAATGEEELLLKHSNRKNLLVGAAWNRDNTQILSWSDDGMINVWNAVTGEGKLSLAHDSVVIGAGWSQDESQILSWSVDDSVRVWDAVTGEVRLTLLHDDGINDAAWNSTEDRIASCSSDGTVRIWDAVTGEQKLILRHDGSVNGAVWSRG